MEWSLLRDVPPEEVRRVLSLSRRRVFGRNEILFHEGDPGETLHLIVKGRVAVQVATPAGSVLTLAILSRGDVVGELALVGAEHYRTATVVALEPVETRALHRDVFTALRKRYPSVTEKLLERMPQTLRQLTSRLVEVLSLPVDKRVRAHLAALADAYRSDDAETVDVPLTQEQIAELSGSTRPTVNQVLRDEEARGSIKLGRGRITVLDRGALERRAR